MKKSILEYKSIYAVGIKGAGMTALAEVLTAHGIRVAGSDVTERFFTDRVLQNAGIPFKEGFNKSNIPEHAELIIYSTAYQETHPEVQAAHKRGIPSVSYPEALGMLIQLYKKAIAISGSHGKTTITALVGWMLERGSKDPTVIIGAMSKNWRSNARIGRSEYFVFEADEYQNKFQYYHPLRALINNIDFDHPDFFTDEKQYRETFLDFVKKIPNEGGVIANYDNLATRHIVQVSGKPAIWYGEHSLADWQLIARTTLKEGGQQIKVGYQGSIFGEFHLKLIGKHNALNALGAIALVSKLGVRKDDIIDALASFHGTSRRLEIIGWVREILIIDDYAHHPNEIKATLDSLKEAYPEKRIYTVFQPHTYSRTRMLLREFAEMLSFSDELLLLDIFGSAREKRGSTSSDDLARIIREYNGNATVVSDPESAISYVKDQLKPGDILLTMGAGETWRVAEGIYKLLG